MFLKILEILNNLDISSDIRIQIKGEFWVVYIF